MTYGWTLAEVDEVEMPMIFALMKEIGELPTSDLLDNFQMRAALDKAERDKKSAVSTFETVKGKVRRPRDGDRSR